MEVSQNLGYVIGDPHNNKNYGILGSKLGSPCSWEATT